MVKFLIGIFTDLKSRTSKMLQDLDDKKINLDVDKKFTKETIDLINSIQIEVDNLINTGELEVDQLISNNIIKYYTLNEELLIIELFRYLIIINYGEPEIYFNKIIKRIYTEIKCLQNPPLITTISNSDNYFWAYPSYEVIAVPNGEEKNLLNLPDLFHEIGHLIFLQYKQFLIGNIESEISRYYQEEIQRVVDEQRDTSLIDVFREKLARWINGWIEEFTCDLIATFLVGYSYAWTNLKLSTLSCGKNKLYTDYSSHPSDESRMRAVFIMLDKMGFKKETNNVVQSWKGFLNSVQNVKPPYYNFIFPDVLIENLVINVLKGCNDIGLINFIEQANNIDNPISKILNDAWNKLLTQADGFEKWEKEIISKI